MKGIQNIRNSCQAQIFIYLFIHGKKNIYKNGNITSKGSFVKLSITCLTLMLTVVYSTWQRSVVLFFFLHAENNVTFEFSLDLSKHRCLVDIKILWKQ